MENKLSIKRFAIKNDGKRFKRYALCEALCKLTTKFRELKSKRDLPGVNNGCNNIKLDRNIVLAQIMPECGKNKNQNYFYNL